MDKAISNPFWEHIFKINSGPAIFHQWDELEKSGCIDNFRIVAGQKEGFREGWVFADSDAYKWLDAACRIYRTSPSLQLKERIDLLTGLLHEVQEVSGYLYTFNQFHFPGQRWVNLQIEHELYCLGHLFEAIASHWITFQEQEVLQIATRAADFLVRDFPNPKAQQADGHEEVEIGLLRLSEVTNDQRYLDQAKKFLQARGTSLFYWVHAHLQKLSSLRRKQVVQQQRAAYLKTHPGFVFTQIPPNNDAVEPPLGNLYRKWEELNGKYFQQHAPINRQTEPVGHSVRFGYLQTALAGAVRHGLGQDYLTASQAAWNRMVDRKMSLTGGIGEYPWNEGFGKDDELHPEVAFNETCAALASMFWNAELVAQTDLARYADLFEWQLYNAALPGLGMDGQNYLYNNPLEVNVDIQRRPWYSVPCCPSNLSRTLADIGKFTAHENGANLYIDQYIPGGNQLVEVQSGFPFEGAVQIKIINPTRHQRVYVRIPSWAIDDSGEVRMSILRQSIILKASNQPAEPNSAGIDPRASFYYEIPIKMIQDGIIELDLPIENRVRRVNPRVKDLRGKVAFTRGPLVFCAENTDQDWMDPKTIKIRPQDPLVENDSRFGFPSIKLTAITGNGTPLELIPYFLWGNRGKSKMTVWIKEENG